MKSIYKNAKSSVQKVGLVADVVRGMLVNEASSTLLFLKKSASLYVRKALMSSVANAQNNFSIDVDRLYVKEILVGKGMKLKRFAARARGRASRVHKHYSNITVLLEVLDGSKS